MTAFLREHKRTKKIFSITLVQAISILQTKIEYTSIAKELLRENGMHHDIRLFSSNL